MKFFIDLDETLVHTIQRDCTVPRNFRAFPLNSRGLTILRPFAFTFLDAVGKLGEVHLLTAAPKPYALDVLDATGMRVMFNKVHSLDDWVPQSPPLHGGEGWFLVDNEIQGLINIEDKKKWITGSDPPDLPSCLRVMNFEPPFWRRHDRELLDASLILNWLMTESPPLMGEWEALKQAFDDPPLDVEGQRFDDLFNGRDPWWILAREKGILDDRGGDQ